MRVEIIREIIIRILSLFLVRYPVRVAGCDSERATRIECGFHCRFCIGLLNNADLKFLCGGLLLLHLPGLTLLSIIAAPSPKAQPADNQKDKEESTTDGAANDCALVALARGFCP